MHIRTTKTSSGATAVQVVCYIKRRMKVLNHVGSANNEEELVNLKKIALDWIHSDNNDQMSFLPILEGNKKQELSDIVKIKKCQYLGFKYQLLYDTLWNLTIKFKFHLLPNSKILNDLVIARLVYPCSKVETFEFIADFFGINHSRRDFYRTLSNLLPLKDEVERKAIYVAKKF